MGTGTPSSSLYFGPANAISVSSDERLIAVGGRDTLRLAVFTKHNKLQALPMGDIRAGREGPEYEGGYDVSFHRTDSAKLATATTGGLVITWDLNSLPRSMPQKIFQADRGINRLCWSQKNTSKLLAACQNGRVYLLDTVVKSGKAPVTIKCHSAVRDVQFSPFYPHMIAVGLENGSVMVYDIRKAPVLKTGAWQGHQDAAMSIDWHPTDPDCLVSGARDGTVHVWNFFQSSRDPLHTVSTMASVGRVRWRGPHQKTQLATAAVFTESPVHVWDINRPFIPVGSFISPHDTTPVTDVHWLRGGVVSCTKNGLLLYHQMNNALRPIETLRSVAVSWSPMGALACVNDTMSRNDDVVWSSRGPVALGHVPNNTGVVRLLDVKDHVTSHHVPPTPLPPSTYRHNAGADPSLDTAAFIHCAHHYALTGDDAMLVNADVARNAGLIQLACMWELLAEICNDDHVETQIDEPTPHPISQHTSPTPTPIDTHLNTPATTTLTQSLQPIPGALLHPFDEPEGFIHVLNIDKMLSDDALNPISTLPSSLPSPPSHGVGSTTAWSHGPGVRVHKAMIGPDDRDYGSAYDHMDAVCQCACGCGCDCANGEGCNCGCGCGSVTWGSQKPSIEAPLPTANTSHVLMKIEQNLTAPSPHPPRPPPLPPVSLPTSPHNAHPSIVADHTSDIPHPSIGHIVADLLAQLALDGDVQTYAVLLNAAAKYVPSTVSHSQRLEMALGYIDILRRLDMDVCAARYITTSHDEDIRNMSHLSTVIHTRCGHCQRGIPLGGPRCCSKASVRCAVCLAHVRGMYVICQGCGHGGCVKHMRQWFKDAGNRHCPTGCGHRCLH